MKSIIRRATSTALAAAMVLSLTPAFDISTDAASVPEGFVYTKGTQFMCDGAPYYYGGTNCYYLTYKSNEAVNNVLDDCVDMGLNVVRVWGHLDAGTKTDQVTSNGYAVFQNSADGSGEKDGVYFQYFDKDLNRPVVNEGADGLRRLDYVIAQAEKRGIKLILTFTNYWQAFGGMEQYCKWVQEAGLGSNLQVDDFYTNETCKQWYKDYVKTLLNHTNYYTGEKLMDSEAVFAWELCNEPRAERSDVGCEDNVLYNWAKEMSEYVKSIDPYHMVSVGDEGFFNYDRQGNIMQNVVDSDYAFAGGAGVDFEKLLSIDTIDFGTPHFYCDSWNLKIDGSGDNGGDDDMDWLKLHAEAAQNANKPVVLEEFGLKDKTIRDEKYKAWLDLMDGTTYDSQYEFQGWNYWMIASYMEDGTYYPDYDSYTVYGPAEVEAEKGTANARNYIIESAAKMNAKNICNLVSPDEASYDKANASDVVLTANMKMGSPSSIQLNGTALPSSAYTISGTTITIKSSYLSTLEPSKYEFKLMCTEGNNPTFVIDVDDTSIAPATIDKESVTVDKNTKKCSDITINMALNGSTLKGIYNNGSALVQGSDYSVSGSTVTIYKSYLMTLAEGKAILTFDFTPAKDKELTITVEDTTGEDEFDAFDSYESSDDLWNAYTRNSNGDEVSLSLTTKNGSQALAYGYNIGGSGYCGITKSVGKDFSAYKGVSLWIEGDGSGNEITIQLEDSDGRYREAYITLDFTGGKTVFIPFSDFVAPSWQGGDDQINAAKITKYSIYAGGNGQTSGTVYFDNIYAANSAAEESKTSISDCSVSLSGYSFDYTGSAITPSVTVKNGSTTLTKGTDYTVSYSNNVNVGTATVTVTGTGNYEGSKSVTFTITNAVTSNDIADCTITLSGTSFEYTGSAIKPKVTVKNGSTTLTSGTDYLVRYANNVEAGTATVVIAGRGDYTGRVEKTFTIVKSSNNIASCDITLSKSTFTYSGNACKPKVTVKNGSTTLTSGTDYVVRYVNNVNVGTATVVIAGKGSYTGRVEKTFQIVNNLTNLSSCTISIPKTTYSYTGSRIKPKVTVKYGSQTLTLNTDYAIQYGTNTDRGTGTIKISGKGAYTGTVTLTFTIQ